MPRRARVILAGVFAVLGLYLLLWGILSRHSSVEPYPLRLLEVRWTNDQPFLILEARLPASTVLFPRFAAMQRERQMVLRNGVWLWETHLEPARDYLPVEVIPPDRKRPSLRFTQYLVRVPFADCWRLEIDSYETRLIGFPFFHKQVSKDFFWRSQPFPGVADMLEKDLTNLARLEGFLQTNRVGR